MTLRERLKNFIQSTLLNLTGYYLVKKSKKIDNIDCYETINSFLKYYQTEYLCDIGSNNGAWAHTMSQLNSNLKHVVLFEPQSKYTQELQKQDIGKAEKVIFNIGLGRQEDKMEIIGGTASASFLEINANLKEEFTGVLTEEREIVEIKSLDQVYAEKKLPQPDTIKIDVQGYEVEVIKGGISTIKNSKFLIVEISFDTFYNGQGDPGEIFQILYQNGFVLIDFGFVWRQEYKWNKKIIQIDGIFANKNKVII